VIRRCAWPRNPLAVAYHDREWGVPLRNDRKLFELLILEGAQAGLSWDTILAKRKNYRLAFDAFDAAKVARYGVRKKKSLLSNAGIVRNRAKIDATIGNARCFLEVKREFGSFSRYLWGFVEGRPRRPPRHGLARDAVSDALSKDLKRRGFKFVGSTIMYAFMQATGMVNDHENRCFRRKQIDAKN
jgi:DNA-3-methyladenine glycosylase I